MLNHCSSDIFISIEGQRNHFLLSQPLHSAPLHGCMRAALIQLGCISCRCAGDDNVTVRRR